MKKAPTMTRKFEHYRVPYAFLLRRRILMKSKKRRVLPGFGLSLGFTTLYISLLVLIPLSMVFIETSKLGWGEFIEIVTSERVLHSYKISFGTAIAAAAINAVFGLIVAWVLVRYSFPGKRILDALIDLPFALPTAVAGITLTTLYSTNGWIGQFFEPLNIKIAFTPLGITIALTFIGLPFIVRMVQPVLQDIEKEVEEAAESLGASRFQIFRKVIFPELLPALLSGFSLAFARGLGEYGSVVFIAGNMPMKTEIAPLMIMTKLEQFDYAGATAIAVVMLIISFLCLIIINLIQMWSRKHELVKE
jgi:sulfate/thiosulfate transport system permease protein